ncbi:deoxyguanosinetriphosphate triphosphohydrolase [bacterium (Candidatus Blackallbacteria) CG17_big_fil_post_rev_8_21_14_2_50_48_46]|uniref:Deoxyguanosinetriphosphate triphosphohydrolase n=1 Tax=bacterium (Candidatus Blackallbacteria) CG17_big_fil_post_rev_8_21_14_2_50_48_46 TaxID=2014261 RepID=A0A2M7G269_9BACT|nr:MAG: deoxyguanosinetriphosphate triphosphohydrolase [bacterium (Candidatus Blackallbacteria) CG18_big_fil_WC_8_21_14_2_50_49_26]PIW15877.1 MAG: deoxyguanosinetriphosphate triphosphohydrolase [bacterium (Candidatus Blackallbacteria) CG17_big_fil_post_rev_8_21_14_2_50_48_46]PIW48658.1 MAG: deoxyguanosinetriphosphate triphosphohydrolase [bacterium (Candidatus Blackallbacteria) CG13_big_fil_rev_8_21_14_2_50_49_14]
MPRYDRRHPEDLQRSDPDRDYREPSQKDRDRILFCSAFRRLAGVTQVVSVQEGHIFHNRLTHSLKVAQIARALALKLMQTDQETLSKLGGLDPNVAETAALAHDLGHPPFGHIAERKLNQLAQGVGLKDGFEGNAQSFRIVTKLAIRKEHFCGLNLSRASLNAILKYPWLYGQIGLRSTKKWGAYFTEQIDFDFARQGFENSPAKSLEAELMDWADDIAYSIHDVEDFYRANLIPLDRLVGSLRKGKNNRWEVLRGSETDLLLQAIFKRWDNEGMQAEFSSEESRENLKQSFVHIISQLSGIQQPYEGSHAQKALLRHFTSLHVSRYINAIKICDPEQNAGNLIQISEDALHEVKMLKELTWHYVMRRPALTAQKKGQVHIIETLFNVFHEAAGSNRRGDWDIFPFAYRERLENTEDSDERTRIVIDLIASMAEAQAVQMYQRLTGTSPGSMLMQIVY